MFCEIRNCICMKYFMQILSSHWFKKFETSNFLIGNIINFKISYDVDLNLFLEDI